MAIDLVVRSGIIHLINGSEFGMDEANEIIETIIDAKLPISRWSLWIADMKIQEDAAPQHFKRMVEKLPNHRILMVGRKTKSGNFFKTPVLRMQDGETKPSSSVVKLGRVQKTETKLGRTKK